MLLPLSRYNDSREFRMIHSIKWQNFFSFAEENEISFVVGKAMPEDFSSFNTPGGTRLSKIIAVLGANASGKTKLILKTM